MRNCLSAWQNVTSDNFILDIIQNGLKIDFESPPSSNVVRFRQNYSKEETLVISSEVDNLLKKGVIVPCGRSQGDFVSSVFTRPKRDGSHRMILNLKKLNGFVKYKKFKMESLTDVLNTMSQNCFMGSIDLKDAYYSIPMHPSHHKYLKFFWQGKFYMFIALPNGYGPAVRMFSKILKVPFKVLRMKGYISIIYIDDSYLQGDSFESCMENIHQTIHLLSALGFTIHPVKSVMFPSQILTFLGFILNSLNMTISLPEDKQSVILDLCNSALSCKRIKIRTLAKLIGNLVSSFPAVTYGPLYFRHLENSKLWGLRKNGWDYEAFTWLSDSAISELSWWISRQFSIPKPIHPPPVDLILHSDASLEGWGGTNDITGIGGRWSEDESSTHINGLELFAAFLTLKSFCKDSSPCHVQLKLDNTTAVCYINNMGGSHSMVCNSLAFDMWSWAAERSIWLSAAHIPGIINVVSDKFSRNFADHKEWALSQDLFDKICDRLYTLDIDLFDTRLNNKILPYMSWKPNPEAYSVDAFTLCWEPFLGYYFPLIHH